MQLRNAKFEIRSRDFEFAVPMVDSHIKVTGMLVVSLWGANCRFSSHLGCLGWKVTIFAHSGIA